MAQFVKLEVDTREFNRRLSEYAATTKKDGDLIVNTAAKHLAYQAVQYTHHADVNQIRALKQAVAIKLKGRKPFSQLSRSQQERRTTYRATTQAFLYYLGRKGSKNPNSLRARGIDPRSFPDRDALEAGALRMVNARISSVNWVRSGWLAAAEYFRNIIGGTTGITKPNISRRMKGVGGGQVSLNGRHTAWIWNASLTNKGKKFSPALYEVARQGLQKALGVSQAKLEQITRERMARHAARFNRP